jgi:hypothetical protein
MTMPSTNNEARPAHRELYRQMGRVFLYSGWFVAFASLAITGKLVHDMAQTIARLRAEIARLTPPPASPNIR